MSVFNHPDFDQHEQVVFFHDSATQLKAIIAIHNTNRGPALGGCRFWNYEREDDALRDVLRLSRGMSYKAALANLNLGGGKAVIIGDAQSQKTPDFLKKFGQFVNDLGGKYITAEDVNTCPEDMSIIHSQTPHVVGLNNITGGSGDPSILTSYGTILGMQAFLEYRFKTTSFAGVRVAIQGLGHVGTLIARELQQKGALLTLTDIHTDHAKSLAQELGASYVEPDSIYDIECDIFSPCALGSTLNETTIPRLRCSIIAGCANNQLKTPQQGGALKELGILYAPDYVLNAGGLINVSYEGVNYDLNQVLKHIDGIRDTLLEILSLSETENIATNIASDRLAEKRFKN